MPSPNLDSERVLPCLLERLTDRYPQARRESREHRTISLRRYRESVLRDLEWLLNCEAHPTAAEFEGLEIVRESVLNYGIRNLTGTWLSTHEASDLEALLREAVLRFEPRILPETLGVRVIAPAADEAHLQGALTLEIVGELWAEPVSEALFIRTEVDLETGACAIERR